MLPTQNGNAKSNGKVHPIDEDAIKENGISIPNEPTKEVSKKEFIFENDKKDNQKENEAPIKKKPQGPKLKTFEIV